MEWLAPIDLYCERMSDAFWAEPLNALSNISFLIGAGFAAIKARALRAGWVGWLLIAMAGLIGVGSFLFHSFANGWSELADVIPIWSFVAVYILALIGKMKGRAPHPVLLIGVAGAALYTLVSMTLSGPSAPATTPQIFNGSLQYAPAWIAMAGFTAAFYLRARPERHWVLGALLAFSVSLVFRSLDLALCDAFPWGTHFVWHLMNGAMIGALLQVYLAVQSPKAPHDLPRQHGPARRIGTE